MRTARLPFVEFRSLVPCLNLKNVRATVRIRHSEGLKPSSKFGNQVRNGTVNCRGICIVAWSGGRGWRGRHFISINRDEYNITVDFQIELVSGRGYSVGAIAEVHSVSISLLS